MQNKEINRVFLDMQMPEMRGDELITSIKTNAKIIITSAYPRYNTAIFGDAYVDYLLKPYTLDEFQAAVKKYEEKVKQ